MTILRKRCFLLTLTMQDKATLTDLIATHGFRFYVRCITRLATRHLQWQISGVTGERNMTGKFLNDNGRALEMQTATVIKLILFFITQHLFQKGRSYDRGGGTNKSERTT